MRRLHVVVPLAFLSMILATSAFAQGRGGGFRGGFGFGGFRRTFFGRGFGRGFGFGFGFGFGYPWVYYPYPAYPYYPYYGCDPYAPYSASWCDPTPIGPYVDYAVDPPSPQAHSQIAAPAPADGR
jgi:hypothetical protein